MSESFWVYLFRAVILLLRMGMALALVFAGWYFINRWGEGRQQNQAMQKHLRDLEVDVERGKTP